MSTERPTLHEATRGAWGLGLALFAIAAAVKAACFAHVADAGLLGWDDATPLGPLLFLGSDALAAAAFGLIAFAVLRALPPGRARAAGGVALRALLVLFALYLGVNLYAFRLLGAPLSPSMSRFAGGAAALADSIRSLVTAPALLVLGALAAGALVLPRPLAALAGRLVRRPRAFGAAALAASAAWFAAGELLARGRRTDALERNALVEILHPSRAVRIAPARRAAARGPLHFDMRSVADPGGARSEDLSRLAGAAGGANLVLVVLESTGARYLGPWGGEREVAPRLAALAEGGLAFDEFYSLSPASMKALFTLFCSMYPYPAAKAETYVNPRLPCRSLPELLAARGWQAALFHSGEFAYSHKDRFFRDRGFAAMHDARDMPGSRGAFRNSWGVDERATVRAMLEHVRGLRRDRPFFLAWIPVFPHHPYEVPDPAFVRWGTGDRFDRYRNSLRYVDDQMAALLDGIAALGRGDDTLVAVVGDHGEAFYQHPGSQGHATLLYEENLRVPLVIHHPRIGARRVAAVGGLPDLTPTLLDLLGVPAEPRHQGVSLLRPHPPRLLPMFTDLTYSILAARDGPFKIIWNMTTGREELYRLPDDPGEKRNLAREHPELVRRLRGRLREWAEFQSGLILNYQARAGEPEPERARARWLHQLPPSLVRYDRRSPRMFSSTAGGGGHRVAGKRYPRGIGMCANTAVRFELDGRYRALTGRVGRDDRGKDSGVVARVLVDGRAALDSGVLRKGSPPVELDLDLRGAARLELVADDPDGDNASDNIAWLEMELR